MISKRKFSWGLQNNAQNLFPFLLFLSLGLFGSSLVAVDWFSAVPGDLGDSRFNSVILEHLYGWVQGRWNSLWSPIFFYPFEYVLAFSDNHFGSVAPYILLRSIGFSREQGFICWYLIGIVLNYISTYYVFRRIGLSGFSAAAGAFVFTFSLPTILSQEMHAQMVYRFAVPLAFLGVWNLFNEKSHVHLRTIFIWTAIQFYCSIYLGLFLVYFLLIFSLVQLALEKKMVHEMFSMLFGKDSRINKYKTFALIIIATACIAYLFIEYKLISSEYHLTRSRDSLSSMLPTLGSYLIGDVSIWTDFFGRWVVDVPARHEHQLFFGLGVTITFIYGLVTIFNPKNIFFNASQSHLRDVGKAASYTILILFFMTLRIGDWSVYKIIAYIPGMQSIQAITRIILIIALPFALIVAIACESLIARFQKKHFKMQWHYYLLIVFFISFEALTSSHYRTPIDDWIARIEPLKQSLGVVDLSNKTIFVTSKKGEAFYLAELDGMILGQDLGIPAINGYSGNMPPGYISPEQCDSYQARLRGYGQFRNVPLSAINSMEKQVLVLPHSVCTPP